MPAATAPTARSLRDDIAAGRRRAVDVARQTLDRIRSADGRLHAFLSVDEASTLAQAGAVDQKRAAGVPLGPLAGVPVALKDNLCVRGGRTTCASRILEHFVSPYDATVVRKLREADAVLVGKTNLDEFAMGSSTENSAFGATRNPWDAERVPGGSSGGSAAAVAAGLVPLALGSDTGGSIRQPAALCGVAGMKPTYGRVSRYGLVAFASSLDQIGPFARNVEDLALLLGVLSGHDPLDSTSASEKVPDCVAAAQGGAAGLRIGVPKEYFGAGIDPQVAKVVREALAALEREGAKLVEVSLPLTDYGIAAYYLVAPAEASSNLARYTGVHYGTRTKEPGDLLNLYGRSRFEGFGPEVRRRIMVGTFALSSGYYDAYYVKALRVRRLIKNEFDAAFANVDVIAGPTSPIAAFRVGEKAADPIQMYLCDVLTVCCNLAGLPGISIPCGFVPSPEGEGPAKARDGRKREGKLPVGLQILGRPFDEATVLRAAAAYERATDFHNRVAPGWDSD